MNMSSSNNDENDAGAPLPDFRASGIQVQTIAPTFGMQGVAATGIHNTPDYLDYDPKGRGIVVTMFANAGMSYLIGITGGGIYGFKQGLNATPSTRFRVQLNSILNHCGRYGSRAGNTLGVYAVLYSLYEGIADNFELEEKLNVRAVSPALASFCNPAFGASMAAMTYYCTSGPRVVALAGTLGFSAVAVTYTAYGLMGTPYGSRGFLFF